MPPPESGALTAELARLTSEFRFAPLPPAVKASARATALDTLGAMLAASSPRYPIGDPLGALGATPAPAGGWVSR